MAIKVVDFFCGCGGTSSGLEKSGMEIVAGVDIDNKALKTFARNFPKAVAISKNIRELDFNELRVVLGDLSGSKLLFAACAPCQPFSTQNRLKNKNDDRISLLTEFHRFVERFQPEFIILENVPGIQSVEGGPYGVFIDFLRANKYIVEDDILNAKDFGVPQSRRRLVLIASKTGGIKLPSPTHGKGLLDYKTVGQTIRHFPPLSAGAENDQYFNHACASMQDITIKRLKSTPEGGDRRDWPKNLWLECHKKHNGHNDVYGRLSWDKPSVTLTTKCISISNGRFGHPEQLRALSVREAAALQSFDDDFEFIGSIRDAAKQVGNAVPVLFAKALGDQVINKQNNAI